ncbi:MAG TPA: tRNA (adenosine(37)-N6)-threonylcarbamoyltransferase complex ATPase subunit type 1 TsaE [Bacillota bacterium]|jgi:tRNA threonylcarbamoyladenosine biosynthesis protein TsaE
MEIRTSSPEATEGFGRRLGALLEPGDVVCLSGPLGAGKTCLARGILAGLGVKGPVQSPTFVIIHEHVGRWPAYHIDAYRLECGEDVATLGLEEYLSGDGVAVVEWPENIADLVPEDAVWISLARLPGEGPDERKLTVTATGRPGQRLKELTAG